MKARSPDDAEAIDRVMAYIQENAGSGIDAAIDGAIEQCVADATSATANRIILGVAWKRVDRRGPGRDGTEPSEDPDGQACRDLGAGHVRPARQRG